MSVQNDLLNNKEEFLNEIDNEVKDNNQMCSFWQDELEDICSSWQNDSCGGDNNDDTQKTQFSIRKSKGIKMKNLNAFVFI